MKILKTSFYIDMHVSPAVVFRSSMNEKKYRKVEKYAGNLKWVEASEEELEHLISIGSAREIEKSIADEFKKDFDICKYR